MSNHPIAPPDGLIKRWRDEALALFEDDEYPDPFVVDDARDEYIAVQAAQWGADQELEACCSWTAIVGGADALRAARRPKPPALKEQALESLSRIEENKATYLDASIIRRALEALGDQ
jgi:hypothetical protein